MRKSVVFFLMSLGACSGEANHLGNPVLLPVTGLGAVLGNADYARVRGKVEVFVKTNHNVLVAELRAGGGPTLAAAFDIAQAPKPIRAAHTLQMQSDLELYAGSPDAMVVAIMVVSGV